MGRPIKPNRSNFYRLFTFQALWTNNNYYEELISEYGKHKIISFIEYLFSLKKFERKFSETDPIQRFIDDKDIKGLSDYYEKDEKNKQDVVNSILFNYALKLKYKFLDEVVFNIIFNSKLGDEQSLIDFFNNSTPKISTNKADQLIKLVNGYETYLERINVGDKSKTQICFEIENELFNDKIVNIRQDYHSYDVFFNSFSSKYEISSDFSNSTKVKILLNTINFLSKKDNL